MSPPSRRTALSVAGAALSTAIAGCVGTVTRPAPPDRCDGVDRPAPELPPGAPDDAVEPADYPDAPDADVPATVAGYVESFEEAYRCNTLLATSDGTVVNHGLTVDAGPTTSNAPHGGTDVRLGYTYFATIETEEGVLEADSPNIVARYYVNDAVALRTAVSGHDAEAPDPLEEGTVVACFG